MNTPEALLRRLDEIGASLAEQPTALALIGLGSVGVERERLDGYSDLDFFVIVGAGSKQAYTDSLAWMSRIQPIAYAFRNTADGYKLLFDDGIFCEFAVFEPAELEVAVYSPGQIVWMAEDFDPSYASPRTPVPAWPDRSVDHLVGEIVTNLYVGLLREHRGECMAAFRMIQGYAIDRVMELAKHLETPVDSHQDPFGPERRFETRHPQTALAVPSMAQGYARNRESAAAILEFLDRKVAVDGAIKHEIEALLVTRASRSGQSDPSARA